MGMREDLSNAIKDFKHIGTEISSGLRHSAMSHDDKMFNAIILKATPEITEAALHNIQLLFDAAAKQAGSPKNLVRRKTKKAANTVVMDLEKANEAIEQYSDAVKKNDQYAIILAKKALKDNPSAQKVLIKHILKKDRAKNRTVVPVSERKEKRKAKKIVKSTMKNAKNTKSVTLKF